jgi:hypothetical protein
MVYHTAKKDPLKCPHSGCEGTPAFSRVDALQRHIVCVALEINDIHPTNNVAPRKGIMKGARAVLKSLRLALSNVHTQAVRDSQPFPDSIT